MGRELAGDVCFFVGHVGLTEGVGCCDSMCMCQANRSFTSSVGFEAGRIHAAAVYCSDGRFGEQCDDLLQNGLKLPRYDRLAVPGGAACFAGHFGTWAEEEGAFSQLRFLIEVHGLERVVLIAHEGCAFYTVRLKVHANELVQRQHEDLALASRRIRDATDVEVLAYFAFVRSGEVQFEQVAV